MSSKPPRKPDWRVSTPSQIDPKRWVDIGAAWSSVTDEGIAYVSIQLDVMPVTGKLSLFPSKGKTAVDDMSTAEPVMTEPSSADASMDAPLCSKRLAYSSEGAAGRAAAAMNRRPNVRNEVEAYVCATCEGWHVGRKKEQADAVR